jgi:hypothetical protein
VKQNQLNRQLEEDLIKIIKREHTAMTLDVQSAIQGN